MLEYSFLLPDHYSLGQYEYPFYTNHIKGARHRSKMKNYYQTKLEEDLGCRLKSIDLEIVGNTQEVTGRVTGSYYSVLAFMRFLEPSSTEVWKTFFEEFYQFQTEDYDWRLIRSILKQFTFTPKVFKTPFVRVYDTEFAQTLRI